MFGEKSSQKKSTNKDVFNTVLKKFRKGLSEDIFIEINKTSFRANKYVLLWVLNNYSQKIQYFKETVASNN